MSNTISLVELVSVNRYGLEFQIAGTHNGHDYRVNVGVECDGRDIDILPTEQDGYDPTLDGDDWFDTVMQDDRFIALSNAGYKAWEAFPTDNALGENSQPV